MKKHIFIVTTFVFSLFIIIGCNPRPGDPNLVFYPIKENGLYGFINENGKVVITPQFLSVTPFSEGLSVVVVDTIYQNIEDDSIRSLSERLPKWKPIKTKYIYMKYGYINTRGQYVIQPNLIARGALADDVQCLNYVPSLNIHSFNDGLAVYMDSTNLYGYINTSGNIVINCQYYFAEQFSEKKAVVTSLDSTGIKHIGVINEKGEPISDFHYSYITQYNKGRAIAIPQTENAKITSTGFLLPCNNLVLLDENGFELKELHSDFFYSPRVFSDDGIARLAPKTKLFGWSFINTQGDYIEPIFKVDDNGSFITPLSQKDIDKLDSLFSNKTRIAICPDVNIVDCTPFHEGFAAITTDSIHWFFVDEYFIVRGKNDDYFYEGAGMFNDGLAPVKKDGKWGYINDNFDIVIPFRFNHASSFDGALATVYTDNADSSRTVTSYINRNGEIVWQKVSFISDVVDNDYAQKKPNMYGRWLVDSQKKRTVDPILLIVVIIASIATTIIIIIVLIKYNKKSRLRIEKERKEQEKIINVDNNHPHQNVVKKNNPTMSEIRANETLKVISERISTGKTVAPKKYDQMKPDNRIDQLTYHLFFDTETTGLPKDYEAPSSNIHNWPRLVQLSWILTDKDYNIVTQQDCIIYPNGFSIPQCASNLHGITTERAQMEGIDIGTVLKLFLSDLHKSMDVIGHNVDFDKKIVGAELIRQGYNDELNTKKSICTMKSTAVYCKIPDGFGGYKWPKLQELHLRVFGKNFIDAHNSMSDVKATLDCFRELKKRGVL